MSDLVHVTEVLDSIRVPELEEFRGRVGNAEANRRQKAALKTGTVLHEFIRSYLADSNADLPARAGESRLVCESAKHYLDIHKIRERVVLVDEAIECPEYGLICTPDLFLTKPYEVREWKTSSSLTLKNKWQVIMQEGILKWRYELEEYPTGKLVRFDKLTGLSVESDPIEYDPEVFDAVCDIARGYRIWRKHNDPSIAAG